MVQSEPVWTASSQMVSRPRGSRDTKGRRQDCELGRPQDEAAVPPRASPCLFPTRTIRAFSRNAQQKSPLRVRRIFFYAVYPGSIGPSQDVLQVDVTFTDVGQLGPSRKRICCRETYKMRSALGGMCPVKPLVARSQQLRIARWKVSSRKALTARRRQSRW